MLQPMVKTMARQTVVLYPMKVNRGAHIQLLPMQDPTLELVDAPEVDCDPTATPY